MKKSRLNNKTTVISLNLIISYTSCKRYRESDIYIFYVYMVAYHHPGNGLVDKTSRLTRECSVFSAVCLGP